MHFRTVVVLLLIAACGASDGEPRAEPTDGAVSETPEPASGPDFLSMSDLGELGFRAVADVAEGELLCGGDDDHCVCFEPLPCSESGDCVRLEANLAAFRSAIANGQDGRAVECRRAELGRCGAFTYFDFSGNTHRHEIRWFDASGRLVSQRNWTDHDAYCGGRASTRLMGRVPRCDAITRGELLCGKAKPGMRTPLDDLLFRAALSAPGE